jgi:hypothetical protein
MCIDFGEIGAKQYGFANSHLASDGDESFPLSNAVLNTR